MKLYKTLENSLKKEPNFVTDEGKVKNHVVLYKAQNFDEELIGLLLEEPTIKEKFFKQIKGITVFDQPLFSRFLEQKNYLKDSYSQYKNKVGLNIDGKYLNQRNEVSLVFPFKDCVLEGGQSTEDQKREEIFFNEILAQDEISQLFEPKVLTNAKTYTAEGEKEFEGFTRDENGTIKDNLVIKGNNLLALHSLKKEFAGKVKIIYIDPPYNTGNDSFQYNDRFNHSSWLTFMKNRLTIAKELLRENGIIFVQCDDNEQAYLKILMDEVFSRENFLIDNVYKRRKTQANLTKYIAPIHEHILLYSKNFKCVKIYNRPLKEEYVKKTYKNPDNDPRGLWRTMPLARPDNSKNKKFFLTMPNGRKIEAKWSCSEKTFKKYIEDDILVIPNNGLGMPVIKKFLKDNKGQTPNSWLENIATSEEASKEIKALFGTNDAFNYAKPEGLLKYLIEITTQKNDIVLDYHLGSGTTAAVAHKMNRQYIGIEQMDYIEDITIQRLQKVIEGEQGGISKEVNWKGGGSFTYLELKKYNQTFVDQLEKAKTKGEVLAIWKQMKKRSFINYNVDIKEQEKNIEEFKRFDLKKQKEILLEMLDKNQLYVNLSSMNDADFETTEAEKKVTKEFYQLNQ